MKKTVAFFFILLANIVLLVHAVVPHHHHKEVVCLESNHCTESAEKQDYTASQHDHEHDQKNTASSCVLELVFALPTHFSNAKSAAESCFVFHIDTDLIQATIDAVAVQFNPPETRLQAPIYCCSVYLKTVDLSQSLRAPPIV